MGRSALFRRSSGSTRVLPSTMYDVVMVVGLPLSSVVVIVCTSPVGAPGGPPSRSVFSPPVPPSPRTVVMVLPSSSVVVTVLAPTPSFVAPSPVVLPVSLASPESSDVAAEVPLLEAADVPVIVGVAVPAEPPEDL